MAQSRPDVERYCRVLKEGVIFLRTHGPSDSNQIAVYSLLVIRYLIDDGAYVRQYLEHDTDIGHIMVP